MGIRVIFQREIQIMFYFIIRQIAKPLLSEYVLHAQSGISGNFAQIMNMYLEILGTRYERLKILIMHLAIQSKILQ